MIIKKENFGRGKVKGLRDALLDGGILKPYRTSHKKKKGTCVYPWICPLSLLYSHLDCTSGLHPNDLTYPDYLLRTSSLNTSHVEILPSARFNIGVKSQHMKFQGTLQTMSNHNIMQTGEFLEMNCQNWLKNWGKACMFSFSLSFFCVFDWFLFVLHLGIGSHYLTTLPKLGSNLKPFCLCLLEFWDYRHVSLCLAMAALKRVFICML